jgi:hypothetical protein
MGKEALIMLLGGVVGLLPFLGFPARIDTIIYSVAGLSLFSLGILVRRDHARWIRDRRGREAQQEQERTHEQLIPAHRYFDSLSNSKAPEYEEAR